MRKTHHVYCSRNELPCYSNPEGLCYGVNACKDTKGQWRLCERNIPGARYGQVLHNVIVAHSLAWQAEQWKQTCNGTAVKDVDGFYPICPNDIHTEDLSDTLRADLQDYMNKWLAKREEVVCMQQVPLEIEVATRCLSLGAIPGQ